MLPNLLQEEEEEIEELKLRARQTGLYDDRLIPHLLVPTASGGGGVLTFLTFIHMSGWLVFCVSFDLWAGLDWTWASIYLCSSPCACFQSDMTFNLWVGRIERREREEHREDADTLPGWLVR